jgi:hypothetical protein
MSGIINRTPQGLLSLLDMVARGQTPRELGAATQLVIEARDLYAIGTARALRVNTSAANLVGYWGGVAVPNNETWLVHGFSAQAALSLAAGTTYRARLAYNAGFDAATGTATHVSLGESAVYTTGSRPLLFAGRLPPLLLPGSTLGVWVDEVTVGTAIQWVTQVHYTPLTV